MLYCYCASYNVQISPIQCRKDCSFRLCLENSLKESRANFGSTVCLFVVKNILRLSKYKCFNVLLLSVTYTDSCYMTTCQVLNCKFSLTFIAYLFTLFNLIYRAPRFEKRSIFTGERRTYFGL